MALEDHLKFKWHVTDHYTWKKHLNVQLKNTTIS
jgi:hypothetical protein